ncbi:MAG: hypothetical protein HYV78_01520 [Candidatus Wildermuthbacteria bacterium]|nr:hypothetical protein [Candidatus Wildermuthbacteria bacterium]
MKIIIFTEGTILMHRGAVGHTREEIVQQVIHKESSVGDYSTYAPIKGAVEKIKKWVDQGAEIVYMTSRRRQKEVRQIRDVLDAYHFPKGTVKYRGWFEKYKDVAESIMPDVLIEDDCESIGGEKEMTYSRIKPELKKSITSIIVKEFGGIDHLPDGMSFLQTWK